MSDQYTIINIPENSNVIFVSQIKTGDLLLLNGETSIFSRIYSE